MVRTESISDINLVIGEKRQRQGDSDGINEDDDGDNSGAVKDKWMSKRPKLTADE